jgi:hypothetical protein
MVGAPLPEEVAEMVAAPPEELAIMELASSPEEVAEMAGPPTPEELAEMAGLEVAELITLMIPAGIDKIGAPISTVPPTPPPIPVPVASVNFPPFAFVPTPTRLALPVWIVREPPAAALEPDEPATASLAVRVIVLPACDDDVWAGAVANTERFDPAAVAILPVIPPIEVMSVFAPELAFALVASADQASRFALHASTLVPIASPRLVLCVAALSELTLLSALSLRNVIAPGLVSVNILWPTVVPPRAVRAVDPDINVGVAVLAVPLPKKVLAAAVESEKVCAGVVVAVVTEVVNSGDKSPELNDVTVPPPPPPVPFAAAVTRPLASTVIFEFV